MEIIQINDYLDSRLLEKIQYFARKYFKNIKTKVGIFQSSKYNNATDFEGIKIYACTLTKGELSVALDTFTWLDELSKVSKNCDFIIWLDSYAVTREKWEEVLLHELKHVQQIIEHHDIYLQAKCLDLIETCTNKSPLETDARLFESNKNFSYQYDWTKETIDLFVTYKDKLREILEAYRTNTSILGVINGAGFLVNTLDINYDKKRKWSISILEKCVASS